MKRSVNKNGSTLLNLRSTPAMRVSDYRIGRIVEERTGGLVVDYVGDPHRPLAARRLSGVATAGRRGDEVMLAFEEESSERPIVMGIFAPRERSILQLRY